MLWNPVTDRLEVYTEPEDLRRSEYPYQGSDKKRIQIRPNTCLNYETGVLISDAEEEGGGLMRR